MARELSQLGGREGLLREVLDLLYFHCIGSDTVRSAAGAGAAGHGLSAGAARRQWVKIWTMLQSVALATTCCHGH